VLSGKTKVAYEDGSEAGPINGIYIHHAISRDLSKAPNLPVSKCGEGQMSPTKGLGKLGSEFLAQGDDSFGGGSIRFMSKEGKIQSGYFIGPSMTLLNQMDLVNYKPESTKVYIGYEIEYLDGHVGSDAAATLMSVTGCGGLPGVGTVSKENQIKLDPNGVAVTQSPKFSVSKDAKIVAARKLYPRLMRSEY
jgi:hypothetical protein